MDAVSAECAVNAKRIGHHPQAGAAQIDRGRPALGLQFDHVANQGNLVQTCVIEYLFSAADNAPGTELNQIACFRLGRIGQLQHQFIVTCFGRDFTQIQRSYLTSRQNGIAQLQRNLVITIRTPNHQRCSP